MLELIAALTTEDFIQIDVCDDLPELVHGVRYDDECGIALFFSADPRWTPEKEAEAFHLAHADFAEVTFA